MMSGIDHEISRAREQAQVPGEEARVLSDSADEHAKAAQERARKAAERVEQIFPPLDAAIPAKSDDRQRFQRSLSRHPDIPRQEYAPAYLVEVNAWLTRRCGGNNTSDASAVNEKDRAANCASSSESMMVKSSRTRLFRELIKRGATRGDQVRSRAAVVAMSPEAYRGQHDL